MDKGYIACAHIIGGFDLHMQDESFQCHNCSLSVCTECLNDTWVFTEYTDEGDKVLNSKDVNKKNSDVFYEMTEYHMFCSKECFEKYYGDYPIINKCYTVIRIQ
jgi:3',5'-cyclic AMP phosphodiesterase CpdA